MHRFLLGFVVSLSFASVACGGRIEHVTGDNAGASAGATSSSSSSGSGSGGSVGGGGGSQCDGRPDCAAGDQRYSTEAEACREIAGFVGCYSRTSCGETIWCSEVADHCAGYPSCPNGYVEVKGCVPDSDCTTASMCGTTIICQRDEKNCLGPQPICDDGDKQVSSPSECLQDDARCYSRSNGCGYTIWCTGPA